jgi:mannitol-specific phosphotransferase system IIBC component
MKGGENVRRLIGIIIALAITFTVAMAGMADFYQDQADREYREGREAARKAQQYQEKAKRHFDNAERYQKQANDAKKREQDNR